MHCFTKELPFFCLSILFIIILSDFCQRNSMAAIKCIERVHVSIDWTIFIGFEKKNDRNILNWIMSSLVLLESRHCLSPDESSKYRTTRIFHFNFKKERFRCTSRDGTFVCIIYANFTLIKEKKWRFCRVIYAIFGYHWANLIKSWQLKSLAIKFEESEPQNRKLAVWNSVLVLNSSDVHMGAHRLLVLR